MIDPAFIEELKYRNPIEDVAAPYVKLRKSGSNLTGLCPFHSEKTGSFTVFTGSRNFYCFGCGAGGDVITFIMKAENLDYPSAVEYLARRSGLTVPEDGSKRYGDGIKKERLYDMNRDAARYFRECLYRDGGAHAYVFEKRKLEEKTVRHFGIGYAPDDFDSFKEHMHGLGYTDAELVAGDLCRISERTGRTFTFFRGRVMFPIIDIYGNIIAFGGRVLDNKTPKYLNSSDTRIFKKSRNLFALNYAKTNCADGFILCEGYMDVIALHEAGFTNAVATLGTALTAEQARLIRRYTDKVIISYDSDDAGRRAANRAFTLLGEAGLNTRILQVEGAKDPDEYIKKYGAAKFSDVLSGSRTEFDYKFAEIIRNNNIGQTDGKIAAASQACALIAGYSSAVEREVYIGRAAEKLSLPPESLSSDVERIIRKRRAEARRGETKQLVRDMERPAGAGYVQGKNMRAHRAENAIIGMLALYPELYSEFRAKGGSLEPEDFTSEFGRRAAGAMIPRLKSGESCDIGVLGGELDEQCIGRIAGAAAERERLGRNDVGVLRDCVEALKSERAASEMSIEDILRRQREKIDKGGK